MPFTLDVFMAVFCILGVVLFFACVLLCLLGHWFTKPKPSISSTFAQRYHHDDRIIFFWDGD